jgi:hypothetical protein
MLTLSTKGEMSLNFLEIRPWVGNVCDFRPPLRGCKPDGSIVVRTGVLDRGWTQGEGFEGDV